MVGYRPPGTRCFNSSNQLRMMLSRAPVRVSSVSALPAGTVTSNLCPSAVTSKLVEALAEAVEAQRLLVPTPCSPRGGRALMDPPPAAVPVDDLLVERSPAPDGALQRRRGRSQPVAAALVALHPTGGQQPGQGDPQRSLGELEDLSRLQQRGHGHGAASQGGEKIEDQAARARGIHVLNITKYVTDRN